MKRLIVFIMFMSSVTLLTACADPPYKAHCGSVQRQYGFAAGYNCRMDADAKQRQQYQQSQPINSSRNDLEQRCNSLRLAVAGQSKSKRWYEAVNEGTEAYERCMLGMPPVDKPKPTTTDCQRTGPDNFRCTTK